MRGKVRGPCARALGHKPSYYAPACLLTKSGIVARNGFAHAGFVFSVLNASGGAIDVWTPRYLVRSFDSVFLSSLRFVFSMTSFTRTDFAFLYSETLVFGRL